MRNPGDIVEINGARYKAAPEQEKGLCTGCAAHRRRGEGRPVACMDLPIACAHDGIIWVRADIYPEAQPTAALYKPAHGGYPGEVKLS